MSDELACSKCGAAGGFSELVTVETSGHQGCEVRANPDGTLNVKRSSLEIDSFADARVIGDDGIQCNNCLEEFASFEEAVANKPVEYRCGECGWWGLQDWLHVDCDGELEEHDIPMLPVEGLVA